MKNEGRTVWIEEKVHEELKAHAAANGQNLKWLLTKLASDYLASFKSKPTEMLNTSR